MPGIGGVKVHVLRTRSNKHAFGEIHNSHTCSSVVVGASLVKEKCCLNYEKINSGDVGKLGNA